MAYADPTAWFAMPKRQAPEVRCRLLCLPHAGGSASSYRGWAGALLDIAQVVTMCPPGRASRWQEPAPRDFMSFVDELAQATQILLDEPLVILGYSMGALVGYELVRRLERHGAAPALLIAAAHLPPSAAQPDWQPATLSDAELTESVRALGLTAPEILDHPEMMELLLPMLRADFVLAESYRYQAGEPLATPILTIAGHHDLEAPPDRMAGWAKETVSWTGAEIDGGHMFLNTYSEQVLRLVRQAIQAAVYQVTPEPGHAD
jgi:surfactin synthase thioesterase subunit